VTKRGENALRSLRQSPIARLIKNLLMPKGPVPRQPPDSKPLLNTWLSERRTEYQDYLRADDNLVHNLLGDTYDADMSVYPRSESAQYKTVLMDHVMEHIHSVAAKRSVPVIFLLIPSPIDVLDQWDASVNPGAFAEYRRSRLTDALEQIAREHNLPFVNLFEPFRSHRAENLYFRTPDDHWNTAGQRLAASLVSDYIVRNHLITKSLPQ
jgi:hypothetical protein